MEANALIPPEEPSPVDLTVAEGALQEGRLDRAEEALHGLLKREPGHAQARKLLAAVRFRKTARAELQLELSKNPEDQSPDAVEFHNGYLSLLFGEMPKGWNQWEARLRVPGYVLPKRNFSEPKWNGESFAGKTLLVHYEQGFGDTLMLVRFLPLVKARGGKVLLLVQPHLTYLMTTCQGVDQILAQGDPLPPFDLQVSLFSLPAVFQTTLDSLPAEIPYLGIPKFPPNRERIAGTLAASEGQLRIGLVWAGSPHHPRDAERSLPITFVNRLEVLPGVAWHSFQLGRTEAPSLPNLVSLAPLLSTFSDTAYALSGMDLVITVDTALAHLAGALGIPTFNLVTYIPDFRWLLDRDDSPWYPTMRIYRQPVPGDWATVLQRVISDLTSGA